MTPNLTPLPLLQNRKGRSLTLGIGFVLISQRFNRNMSYKVNPRSSPPSRSGNGSTGGRTKLFDVILKLLMVGDSQVGKSSLSLRFSDNKFRENFVSTIGIDFKIKTVELQGKKIKLQIWDTAGQERFHTITTSYYRGAMGIMLVYDITQEKTFDNIAKWLRNIQEHANEDVEKMLLGNKCDMEDKRMISKERGEAISRENGIKFLETSAKANINVEKAFMTLAEDILKKYPQKDSSTTQGAVKPDRDTGSSGSKCC